MDSAEELPAQWSVMKDLPTILTAKIYKAQADVSYTNSSIKDLENRSSLSTTEEKRLEVLKTSLVEYQNILADLTENKSKTGGLARDKQQWQIHLE